jgi:UDP-N-acetylmuramate--alanine ligase
MQKIKNIHFIGIGGSGMNGIAEVLLNLGYNVSGSDLTENASAKRLAKLGAKIFIGHKTENLAHADIVVVSTAIKEDNPELIAAYKQQIPVLPRAQMLAELMRFHQGIAIAGTHGKTTTTSIISSIFIEANFDPTFVIGGVLNGLGANAKLGSGKYFIAEADESDASFLRLQPIMSVVTNIDADHMQTYDNDFTKLRAAFISFLQNLPFYGLAIVCNEDPVIRELLPKIGRPTITYGFTEDCDIWAENCTQQGMTCGFTVHRKNAPLLNVTLNLPGKHNILNTLAAIAVATECDIPDSAILTALANFKGVGRRLQFYGDLQIDNKKVAVFDDYGHHPNEIKATLKAMQEAWPQKRIVLAFQPHRYTRVQSLFDDFAEVLSSADLLLLLEIYSAGEKPLSGISGRALANNIRKRGKTDPVFIESTSDLIEMLPNVLHDNDVLILQGAGNIGAVAGQLREKYLKT